MLVYKSSWPVSPGASILDVHGVDGRTDGRDGEESSAPMKFMTGKCDDCDYESCRLRLRPEAWVSFDPGRRRI